MFQNSSNCVWYWLPNCGNQRSIFDWLWPETKCNLFSHDRIKHIVWIKKTFNYSPCMSSRINVPVLYFPSNQEDLNYRWRFWLQSKVSFHLCAVVWNNPHGLNYQGNDLLSLKWIQKKNLSLWNAIKCDETIDIKCIKVYI